jgi:hypothetical protein
MREGQDWICPICGELHTDLPHIGSGAPYQWTDEYKDDPNSLLSDDLCIIEGRDYFVRGVIEIPVHDYKHAFGWGVWISHKKENFEIYRDNPDSADIGPFFGWLSTEIEYYRDSTLNLKTMAHYQSGNLRPLIEVEPFEHLLSDDQRNGITLAEAWEMVHFYD